MGKDTTNIYDVAKKAGVGIGTVSRVLNQSDKVKTETREKVLKVIAELNYRPNRVAQNLASQKANAIAVIVPTFIDHFFVEVLKGIQSALETKQIDLILHKINKEKNMLEKIIDIVHSKSVDGIVAVTMDIAKTDYQVLLKEEIPVVLADENCADFHSIYFNDQKGAALAINYLIAAGHQDIAFLNGQADSQHGQERLKGVKSALAEAGLNLKPELYKANDFNTEAGYQAMQSLLELSRDYWPTAVFAASDNQAIGVLKAMEEKDLKVPEDMAVIGYDNIELAKYLRLTTVAQPMFKLGRLAVEVLLKAIREDIEDNFNQELELELLKRETA